VNTLANGQKIIAEARKQLEKNAAESQPKHPQDSSKMAISDSESDDDLVGFPESETSSRKDDEEDLEEEEDEVDDEPPPHAQDAGLESSDDETTVCPRIRFLSVI
jgi:hypothetical protein